MKSLQMDEDVATLRQVVDEVCRDLGGLAVARGLEDGRSHDARAWQVLTEQIGVSGLGLPEECGGLGGMPELVAVAEVLGAHLLPTPFFTSTVLAGQVLAEAGAAAVHLLEAVAGGTVAAYAGPTGDPAVAAEVSVEESDGVLRASGSVPLVAGLPGAELVVLLAAEGTGRDAADRGDLFVLRTGADGVRVEPVEGLDLSRPAGRLELSGAEVERLTSQGTGAAAGATALDRARIVLAAEQLGVAQAALDLTVAYVKERHQFGRAIGSFQAVKHRCADLLLQVEAARSAVVRAVAADGADERAEAASVAQAWCSDMVRTVTSETIQLHGGIGFTWEHDAHLFFRRARSDAPFLGSASFHRARLADVLAW